MEEKEPEQQDSSKKFPSGKEFWHDIAWRHLTEMRLLFRGGQLWSDANPRDHWRNAAEHCLVETALAEELGELLKLSAEDTRTLATALAVHDWDKRVERTGLKLTEAQRALADSLLEKIRPDQALIDVTKPTGTGPLQDLMKKHGLDLRELAFYIDNICNGPAIEKWGPRLDAASLRNPEVPKEHFDEERALSGGIEQKIFERLKTNGVEIDSPDNVPEFLKAALQRHYKYEEPKA